MKHISDFHTFVLSFSLFKVAHKLRAFYEFLAKLCANESLVQLKWQDPVKVFVGRKILNILRRGKQLTVCEVIFAQLIDSVTDHKVEEHCTVELNGWFRRLLL